MSRIRKEAECIYCKKVKKIYAKELCGACYSRLLKTGSLEYQKWGIVNTCQISECENKVVSNGLCDKHRKRLSRQGHTDQTRPNDWGDREKHPLYHSWGWIKRQTKCDDDLHDWSDFWRFVKDVGERPSRNHKLNKIDSELHWNKNNFIWLYREPYPIDKEECNKHKANKVKEWREDNPNKAKNMALQNKYGISYDEYMSMHKDQGGKCLICNEKEKSKDHRTNEVRMLAVDHCHSSGKVRGLLCSQCNTGLGLFKDDISLLKKAAVYLSSNS